MDKLICPKCNVSTEKYKCPKCGLELACSMKRTLFGSVESIKQKSDSNNKKKVLLFGLIILLFGVIGFSYWRFVYYKPDEFIMPVVLSAQTGAEGQKLAKFNSKEKTISVKVDLDEGNFLVDNLYQFVPSNIPLVIQGFGITNILKNHADSGIYETFKKDFDMTDDDIDTYLSDSFLVLFPKDTINEWGFVIGVDEKGKDFVEERINRHNEEMRKETGYYKYGKYNARLVKIVTNGESKQVVDDLSATKLLNIDEKEGVDSASQSEVTQDEKNDVSTLPVESSMSSESTDEQKPVKIEYFLLISTSEDFLDQMKENSEGNIENLSTDIEFVRARDALPGFGQLFIFKQGNKNAWEGFVGRFVLEYKKDGLEELLNSYKSIAIVMHSVDSKLKIIDFGLYGN